MEKLRCNEHSQAPEPAKLSPKKGQLLSGFPERPSEDTPEYARAFLTQFQERQDAFLFTSYPSGTEAHITARRVRKEAQRLTKLYPEVREEVRRPYREKARKEWQEAFEQKDTQEFEKVVASMDVPYEPAHPLAQQALSPHDDSPEYARAFLEEFYERDDIPGTINTYSKRHSTKRRLADGLIIHKEFRRLKRQYPEVAKDAKYRAEVKSQEAEIDEDTARLRAEMAKFAEETERALAAFLAKEKQPSDPT